MIEPGGDPEHYCDDDQGGEADRPIDDEREVFESELEHDGLGVNCAVAECHHVRCVGKSRWVTQ
ncbi:MAG: hypothetical protein WCA96_06160 [Methylocella sp.]